MKIQGSDIEFTSEMNESPSARVDRYYRNEIHILRFVKAPKGRRKDLIIVQESFDARGKLTELTLELYGPKTQQERRKLLSALIRGTFGSQAVFQSTTLEILKAPYMAATETFFVRFG